MKPIAAIGLLALVFGFIAPSFGAECQPTNPGYVCGLKNAEDLVRLSGTPWIVATHIAGRNGFGPLEAVNIDSHEVQRLFPTPDSAVKWDRKTYPDCNAPPESISRSLTSATPAS